MIKKASILSIFLLFNIPAYSTSVLIWDPVEPNNRYGHAAIQTNVYHMSLWPDGDTKQDYGEWATINGVPASLNFHHRYDKSLEGNRIPKQYDLNHLSQSKINQAYEEM